MQTKGAKITNRTAAAVSLDELRISRSQSDLPSGYPARPASDAICGYLDDLGPFYTKTLLEIGESSQVAKTRARIKPTGEDAELGVDCGADLPSGYPASPAPDAICGYLGDLGPFYTKTLLELEGCRHKEHLDLPPNSCYEDETDDNEHDGIDAATETFLTQDQHLSEHARQRRVSGGVRFADGAGERESRKERQLSWYPLISSWRRGYESVWICVSLGALLLSSILLMTSFVTSSWGVMIVPPMSGIGGNPVGPTGSEEAGGRRWNFGLWQCCRDDGLCLGMKWPGIYSAIRAFAILSLFGHALTFAWMLGHTLEKIMYYDTCTMMTLITICFITTAFSLISVICFGVKWPSEFYKIFPSSSANLGYSYFLAVCTIPLTIVAGVFAVVDFKGTWKADEIHKQFGDDITDEDHPPKHRKRSRRRRQEESAAHVRQCTSV